jgi:ribonuclease G
LDDKGILGKLILDLSPYGLNIVVNDESLIHIIETIGSGIDIQVKDIKEMPSLDRKVNLKNGGFITIDSTEALITVDVNSGRYIGHKKFEQTALEVNLEATEEIAKQIRLRDLGGIIIIDYIDMLEQESKKKVLEHMTECIKKDRTKVQVVEMSKLCLLEMTRKPIFGRKI